MHASFATADWQTKYSSKAKLMTLDPYQLCPCGAGKKIKFCCCKDIVHDLDKVFRAVESEQRMVALDQIKRLIKSKGERAGLLALKAEVEMQSDEFEAAEATIGKFLELHPDNPIALAQSALLGATNDDDPTDAVAQLQLAIASLGETIPAAVYETIGLVGRVLLGQGEIMAARAHLLMQATMGGADDPRPMQLLMQIHSARDVPLLMKQDWRFAERSPRAAWAAEFDEAMAPANRGVWSQGLEKLVALDEKFPREPVILRNIAILRSWLADPDAAVAWRAYARAGNILLDDAVEAEAVAQLLNADQEEGEVDVVSVAFKVNDTEKLTERLAADRRISRMPIDPSTLAGDDQPPPRGVYWVLDRKMPSSADGLTRETVPHVLGELYFFGRQTNRDPRLEFVAARTDDFETNKSAAQELFGDLIGDVESEEVTDSVGTLTAALTWNWRLPDDTPPKLRAEMIAEQRKHVILNKWPDLPQQVLDGKRPSEVAGDPAYRVRLLAAILLLELSGEASDMTDFDYNLLRGNLGLPTRDEIDPESVDVSKLSLVRLARVKVSKLSDEKLTQAYQRAGRLGARTALTRLAKEVVGRDSLDGKVDKLEAYEFLARLTNDFDEALGHLHKARDLAVAAGQSPAVYLVSELALRLERGVPEGCEELIKRIQNRHINEPGVQQAFLEVLVRAGIISPEGRPGAGPERGPAPAMTAEQPSAASSELWTPDGGAAASSSGEGKSKLWLPGMD